MKSPKLHHWIADPESSALLINFNSPSNQRSTSFLAAKLMDSVGTTNAQDGAQPGSVFALSFLCGEHLNSEDPDSGIDGMMKSLIAQLLLSFADFGVDIVKTIQKTDIDSIEDLCRMFYLLVAQLPRHAVVFCILDAVTWFEEKKVQIDDGCVFKLLLTSPWNSRILHKHILGKENVIWMPAKMTSQGGFTKGKWNSSIGSAISLLEEQGL